MALTGHALAREYNVLELMRRPELTYANIVSLDGVGPVEADPAIGEQIEIQTKYAGYIERQQAEVARSRTEERVCLPVDLDYAEVAGLSTELVQKLSAHRPESLGQAGRIAGITPAAISVLKVYLKRGKHLKKSA